MPSPPLSLRRFLRNEGAALERSISGRRTLADVREICARDRWNSFDRFHDTTDYLVDAYERAGAKADVHRITTGGRRGDGRWIIREASDIRSATVDVVTPVRKRIIDYRENPWQVIQYSAATPRKGLRADLVVVDSREDLKRRKVAGKVVLTRLPARELIGRLSAVGAVAVITDRPVNNLPNATAWTKFGWGAIPLDWAGARLVGLVLSENEGKRLRRLADRHDRVTLHLKVDVRPYVGEHDLVSGIVPGIAEQEELWVLAHSAEPGAIDNASGVAVCLEAARALESAIRDGRIRRPKRSIRFLSGFECYAFFHYMEHVRRHDTPLAGLCIDTVGARPDVCDGQLSWRAAIPMSATFVDRIGEAVTRHAIRRTKPGYRLVTGPFVSTSDTLAGDPKYGFPCPWITTHYRKGGKVWNAYHSSADVPALLSPAGLAASTLASASYLAYLADADERAILELADNETTEAVNRLRRTRKAEAAEYVRLQHHASLDRLERWIWSGPRDDILRALAEHEKHVSAVGPKKKFARSRHTVFGRVPRRKVPIAPTPENTRGPVNRHIREARLPQWSLFWADGRRTIADIARLIGQETGAEIDPERVSRYFDALTELGYTDLFGPDEVITRRQLADDFEKLGVKPGMLVMMHSSLSKVGHVENGADGVIDALLSVLGRRGTLMMPSFNHGSHSPYNPRTSPTVSGAIPDAFWRRIGVRRSNQPTHPVAAFGPLAEELTAGHVEAGLWTADSPIARMIRAGGHILSLGVNHWNSTAYHVAEVSVPCGCLDPVGWRNRIVDDAGSIRVVPGLAWRNGECPVSIDKLNAALSKRPEQKAGKIGKADATLVPAKLLYDTRRRQLRNVCPTCTIKPHVYSE